MIYWNELELNKNNGNSMNIKTKNALLAIACAIFMSLCPLLTVSAEDCDEACCEWGNYSRVFVGPFGSSIRIQPKFKGDKRCRKNKRSRDHQWQDHKDRNGSLHGSVWGIYGGYEFKKPLNIYAGLIGDWGCGSLNQREHHRRRRDHQDGHLDGQHSNRDHHKNHRHHRFHTGKIEARLGYSFNLGWDCEHEWEFTPYTGFGFKYINHDHSSFLRRSFLDFRFKDSRVRFGSYYVPVGFLSKYTFNDWLIIGFNFEWMPQVDSTVKFKRRSHLLELENESNFEIELPLSMQLGCENEFGVSLIPFWKYIKTGRSKGDNHSESWGRLHSPELRYTLWGAKLIGEYNF
jgi:hypothetical protein